MYVQRFNMTPDKNWAAPETDGLAWSLVESHFADYQTPRLWRFLPQFIRSFDRLIMTILPERARPSQHHKKGDRKIFAKYSWVLMTWLCSYSGFLSQTLWGFPSNYIWFIMPEWNPKIRHVHKVNLRLENIRLLRGKLEGERNELQSFQSQWIIEQSQQISGSQVSSKTELSAPESQKIPNELPQFN